MIRLTAPMESGNYTPTQRAGKNYEARVSRWLEEEYAFYPQLAFDTPKGLRVPDGLLFHPKGLVVVEVKTQHSEAAKQQLTEYVEVVSSWAKRPVYGLEICETLRFDILAKEYRLVHTVEELFDSYSMLNILAMLRFRLPRLRGAADSDGMGDAGRTAEVVVRATGGTRDSVSSLQCGADVVAT